MAAVFGNKPFTINDWHVDPASDRIMRGDHVIKLDPQNMKVLEVLASRPGEVISQAEIEESAWPGVVVTPNSVYQSIAQLRKALGDDRSSPKYIETIARKGYRCVALVAGANPLIVGSQPSHSDADAESQPDVSRAPVNRVSVLLIMATIVVASGAFVYFVGEGVAPKPPVEVSMLPHIPEKEPVDQRIESIIEMASSALSAGNPRESLGHLQDALRLAKTVARDEDPLIGRILSKMADAYYWYGDWKGTVDAATEALRILEMSGPELDPRQMPTRLVLGEALIDVGDYGTAEYQIQRSYNLALTLHGATDPKTIACRGALARLRMAQNRWADAETISRDALNQQIASRGSRNFQAVNYRLHLATSLQHLARQMESIEQAQLSLRELAYIARDDHPYVTAAQQVLADGLLMTGAYEEAEHLSRTVLATLKSNDSEPWRVARAASSLGESLRQKGHLDEAGSYLRYAARVLEGQSGQRQSLARTKNETRLLLLKTGEGE